MARLNIGIMITERDMDIAAWFNEINSRKQSIAKWISALLVAEQMGKELPPVYTYTPPLAVQPKTLDGIAFGISEVSPKWKYGWQLKGKNGEFVKYSVVNIAITNVEIITLLRQLQKNHAKLSTFIKGLIHKNFDSTIQEKPLRYGDVFKLLNEYTTFLNRGTQFSVKNTVDEIDPVIDFSNPKSIKIESPPPVESGEPNPLLSYIN